MAGIFKWFLMLNKRLYKKATFVVILALIPVCVAAFSIASKQDSGFLQIALAQTDSSDAVSSAVIDELLSEESIIHFYKVDSPSAALDAVETGRADEAWIMPENMQEKINEYVTAGADDGFVTVVSREQNMLLRIAHEKLTAALYKYCASVKYIDFTRANIPRLDALSDEQLMDYFNNVSIDEELFVFGNPSIGGGEDSEGGGNYLTSPIRGLLGVLVVLCGMAAAMYYMQDERSGTFARVRESNRIYVAFFCLLIAVLNVASVVLISLYIAGLAASVLSEILNLVLFSLCTVVFCLALKQIFCSIGLYGSIIPMLTVVMIAVCPVFFDFKFAIQLLFPPTYYVNAAYDSRYLLYMVAYSAVGALFCLILEKIKRIRFNKKG